MNTMTDYSDLSVSEEHQITNNSVVLDALVRVAGSFGQAVDARQLEHRLGAKNDQITDIDLCRCARWAGLRARMIETDASRLITLPLPAMLETSTGWVVLEDVSDQDVSIFQPNSGNSRHYSIDIFTLQWTGKVLLLAEGSGKVSQAQGFSWFLPSIRKHIRQFRTVLLVSLMMQMIPLVTPFLFQNVIDRVLVSRSLSSLQVLGFALLMLAIFEPVYGFLRSWVYSNLASKVNSELTSRLYQHLMALPVHFFQKNPTGTIISRIREMNQVRQFLTGSALTMLLDLVFVVLFLGVMFFYASELTWLVIGSLVVYFLFWLALGPVLRNRVKREYELTADNTAFLSETVTGIETVKTSATEQRFIGQWEHKLATQVRAALNAQITGIWAGQGIGLVQKITSALVLWWGVTLVMDGALTPGGLVAFNMLSGHVTQPILRLAQIWQDFQHTLIALKRVGDILNEPEESNSAGLASIPQLNGSVEFRNVRFRYDAQSHEVISNLNLTIKAGEFIGITGSSGSGKSTAVKLLQRLYVPQHGQVFIDGVDLAVTDPVELRRKMSVVPQESVLFSGSIADNIKQCRPEATDQEVVQAACLAGADEFIAQQPQGYNTPVGEKGSLLSGGQRQRIALARALITNPRILLLDEATSALDYESEAAVMANMSSITQGRTVISIAHRLNTLRHADRILVMEHGQLAEQGSHEELVAAEGIYSKLWKLQVNG